MRFTPTTLKDAYLINLEPRSDGRGFFARFFCAEEMALKGLESRFLQMNNSLSISKGTLRGMHYQLAPAEEVKIVRCLQGALYDVILDIRPHSPTFKQWFGTTLSAVNRTMMYVPKGFAHGFLTLQPNTEILYMVSHPYHPQLERGIRWDDPAFNIKWPQEPVNISERDQHHPDFDPAYHLNQV